MPSSDSLSPEQRLQALEDERDIRDLLSRYGESLDYGLEEQFVSLFTEDGVWRSHRPRSGTKLISGADELTRFARNHTRAPMACHKHIAVDAQIVVDGDTATCVSYFMRLDGRKDGKPSWIWGMGRYRDRLVRRDGRWLFLERVAELEDDWDGRPA